jgi:hypothetical protein
MSIMLWNFGFEVQKRYDGEEYRKIAFIPGNGTTTNRITYNFTDNDIKSDKIYYRLKQIDYNGDESYSSEVLVDIQSPNDFILFQNYPNPFNPTTKISWQSPVGGVQTLKLYDMLGNEVATLLNEYKEAGKQEIVFNASSANGNLTSGVYLLVLKTDFYQKQIKMVYMK